jgi:V/A-type H+/Na+-transporting ATPase subunit D
VYRERVARMQGAVRRVTQRVNLFEKVLIPNAKQNIARIQIFLSDVERAAVVTSKIAKGKRALERAAADGGSQEVR